MVFLGDVVTDLVLYNCRSPSQSPNPATDTGKVPVSFEHLHSPSADWVPPPSSLSHSFLRGAPYPSFHPPPVPPIPSFIALHSSSAFTPIRCFHK